MKRRDALASLAITGAVALLPACTREEPDEAQLRAVLRLNGMQLRPGEGAAVLASFKGSRFTTPVDPTIQPTDFDAGVDG